MVYNFAKLILENKITIEDVPPKYRDSVEHVLQSNKVKK